MSKLNFPGHGRNLASSYYLKSDNAMTYDTRRQREDVNRLNLVDTIKCKITIFDSCSDLYET